jgi:hypothetical protein
MPDGNTEGDCGGKEQLFLSGLSKAATGMEGLKKVESWTARELGTGKKKNGSWVDFDVGTHPHKPKGGAPSSSCGERRC